MAMTYAQISGRVCIPGTQLGVRATVTATPVPNAALVFPAQDRITWGPQTTTTDAGGYLSPPLKIPLNPEGLAPLWQITLTPTDAGGARQKWTLGAFSITADTNLAALVA